MLKRLMLSAVAMLVAATVYASVSQVSITTLGASGDKWRVALKDANGNLTGAVREQGYAVVSPYYNSGSNSYVVPLSVLGFNQSQINAAGSTALVTHYIPGSGAGCSGGFCPLESLIEILD